MSAPAEDAACHFGNWLLPTNVGFRAMTLDGGTTAMSSDAVFGLKATELRVEPRYRLTLLRYRQTLPLAGCGYRQRPGLPYMRSAVLSAPAFAIGTRR